MKSKLVAIGNSRGIRLPKSVLEQVGLEDEIELEVRSDHLVLRSPAKPRAGWDAAFARMRREGHDALLDPRSAHAPTTWDRSEWKW
jgi:antitoxin MazE